MPVANVRGIALHYEVLGARGPWVSLSPGGRRALDAVKSLAQRIAAAGYRVLLHDRRNCGASDVVIDGAASEYEIWVEDLHALTAELDAAPLFIGGASSGCRLSVLFALRYPGLVRGLMLWRVTGGRFAAQTADGRADDGLRMLLVGVDDAFPVVEFASPAFVGRQCRGDFRDRQVCGID